MKAVIAILLSAAAAASLHAQEAPAPAPASSAPASAPAAAPLPADRRAAVIEICTAEAQRRGKAMGATDVSLREVEDTDLKSDGFAAVRAEMNLVTTDKNGKAKTQKKTVTCEVRDTAITKFKVS